MIQKILYILGATICWVGAILFSTMAEAKTCAGLEVTATVLNVRTGPGTHYSRVGAIHRGERYTTIENSGNWKKIWFNDNSHWIYAASYTRAMEVECGEVTTSVLNVRSGPGTGYRKVGTAPTGSRWAVIDISGAWRKIWYASEARWVHGGYLDQAVPSPAIELTMFNINNDAVSTQSRFVTTYHFRSGTAPREYRLSDNSNFSGATWCSYVTRPQFTLSSGNGVKRLYFQLRDVNGRLSNVMSDTITLNLPPVDGPRVIDRTPFFTNYRSYYGALNQSQVDGINFLLGNMEQDTRPAINDKTVWIRQLAYIFATTKHEVADTYKPITEYSNTNCVRYDGGCRYKGRGYVQLTHRYNYEKMSPVVGVDLVASPEKALEPNIAYTVMSYGMFNGSFTGKKLGTYVKSGTTDYYNARRVVNGLDRATLIKGHAENFQTVLERSAIW